MKYVYGDPPGDVVNARSLADKGVGACRFDRQPSALDCRQCLEPNSIRCYCLITCLWLQTFKPTIKVDLLAWRMMGKANSVRLQYIFHRCKRDPYKSYNGLWNPTAGQICTFEGRWCQLCGCVREDERVRAGHSGPCTPPRINGCVCPSMEHRKGCTFA